MWRMIIRIAGDYESIHVRHKRVLACRCFLVYNNRLSKWTSIPECVIFPPRPVFFTLDNRITAAGMIVWRWRDFFECNNCMQRATNDSIHPLLRGIPTRSRVSRGVVSARNAQSDILARNDISAIWVFAINVVHHIESRYQSFNLPLLITNISRYASANSIMNISYIVCNKMYNIAIYFASWIKKKPE